LSALTEFLFPAPAPRTAGGIIAWWENRRLAYNLAVGAAGVVTVTAVSIVESLMTGNLQVVPWPFLVLFGVGANVMYLLGPLIEILIDRVWGRTVLPIGPSLYRMGLTFSVGLALFPTLLVTIALVAWVVAGILGFA